MDRVEEGVANFKDFQREARAFFTRADTREEERKESQNKRDAEIKESLEAANTKMNMRLSFAGIVVAILTLLVGWLAYRDSERKTMNANPVTSAVQYPEDSKLPDMR